MDSIKSPVMLFFELELEIGSDGEERLRTSCVDVQLQNYDPTDVSSRTFFVLPRFESDELAMGDI